MATSAALHTIRVPLTPQEVEIGQADHLEDLQGNILKGHGRRHSAHLFLAFKTFGGAAARQWVREVLRPRLTTARQQLQATEAFKASGKDGGAFSAFFLSAAGYTALGKDLSGFVDPSFRAGIRGSVKKLHDPAVTTWDTGYQGEIHAMVLIADARQANVFFLAQELSIEVQPFAKVLHIEFGDQIHNERGDGIEHFGYVDGRSQPLMLESDLASESDGMTLWKPQTGPAQVLVQDPFGAPGSSGSYFVFRKLEELVRAFKTQEQKLADKLLLSGAARELAGALVIGRFEDGTPVTLSKTPQIESALEPNESSVPNNFDYRDDLDGRKCPFQAHIRKSNPRGAGPGGLVDENTRHMARRGITYGKRDPDSFDDVTEMPEDGVGLLFMSYQRSIVEQFEFIQQAWVNSANFPASGVGLDPVIGQFSTPPGAGNQHWPKTWDAATSGQVDFNFSDFVHMKGGEYFFAPSLSGIANL